MIKKLFCKHKILIFKYNIFGDLINLFNGRSIYFCKNCDKLIIKDKINV